MNYIDVNVFVYWLTDHPDFGEPATRIIKNMELGERACTSSLTVWMLHILLRKEVETYSEETLLGMLSNLKNLKIVPLTYRDFLNAQALKKDLGFDFEDSLHYAVAERMNAEVLYSNDRDFDRGYIARKFEEE
jgi:predicted nucleic acid-binding protein